MSFVIIFDIPRPLATDRVRINRELNRMGATRVQDSLWRLDNLKSLTKLGLAIRDLGGKAEILEEKFLF